MGAPHSVKRAFRSCRVVWMIAEDGAVAVWKLAVDEASAWRSLDEEERDWKGGAEWSSPRRLRAYIRQMSSSRS